MQHQRLVTTGTTYAVLVAGALATMMLPRTLTVSRSVAAAKPDSFTLNGVAYDFLPTHPDFDIVAVGGDGHYGGNIAPRLDEYGRPQFIGMGSIAAAAYFGAPTPKPYAGPIGYDTAFSDEHDKSEKQQIATRIKLPQAVTVTGLTAYVGRKDKEVRYAIYDDAGGEPGTLVAQTGSEKADKKSMKWQTIALPSAVSLDPGYYWLSLALGDKKHRYASNAAGGVTRTKNHKAAKDGFLGTWGASDSSSTERISIYANFSSEVNNNLEFGHDTVFGTGVDKVRKQQIATRVDLPEAGTLLSITAFVGNKDKDVRYAIYDDDGGQPGQRLAQTSADQSSKSLAWLTLAVPDVQLAAGTYWLALAFEDDSQAMVTTATGGATRRKDHDAAKNGFGSTWGTSDTSGTEKISIYGTYVVTSEPPVPSGFKVTTERLDAASRPIAPKSFQIGSDEFIDFAIVNQSVIPEDEFVVEARVLGAAIQTGSGGYHRPVTMQLVVGGTVFEPFGPYDDAVLGNVNDDQTVTCDSNGLNPRCSVLPATFSAGTTVRVDGKTWTKTGSTCTATSWNTSREARTADNGVQIRVLRNGDPVPDIKALYSQSSIDDYVGEYIDYDTNLMSLGENQIIYLFELGTSGNSSSADFQDLVVLITLAQDDKGLCGATTVVSKTLCGDTFGDVEGKFIPGNEIDASGGISSATSFAEWFAPDVAERPAVRCPITLVDNGLGVYEYTTNAFFPLDDRAHGNGGGPHNDYFTYAFAGQFEYVPCGGQFIEFAGGDDAWMFLNGHLVMDLGGLRTGTSQFIDMDRLGLQDGESCNVRFFHARRQTTDTAFRLHTNIRFKSDQAVMVSNPFD